MISNGGWHFSFLGNPEKLARKIQAFSHQEYNLSEYTDPGNLQKRIDNAIDLFSRKEISLKYVPLDSSFPFHLLENRDKYKHLIKEI